MNLFSPCLFAKLIIILKTSHNRRFRDFFHINIFLKICADKKSLYFSAINISGRVSEFVFNVPSTVKGGHSLYSLIPQTGGAPR